MNLSLQDTELFRSSLPIPAEDLLAADLDGVTPLGGRKFAVASTFQSKRHPGFVHYGVFSGHDQWQSRRPVAPYAVGLSLDSMLQEHGLTCADLRWKRVSPQPREWSEPGQRPSTASIYFIQPVDGGLVKIGVSYCPAWRLRELQVGCPVNLQIVKTINDVPRSIETRIHRQFAQFRIRGEWFDPVVLTMEIKQ